MKRIDIGLTDITFRRPTLSVSSCGLHFSLSLCLTYKLQILRFFQFVVRLEISVKGTNLHQEGCTKLRNSRFFPLLRPLQLRDTPRYGRACQTCLETPFCSGNGSLTRRLDFLVFKRQLNCSSERGRKYLSRWPYHFEIMTKVDQSPQHTVFGLCFNEESAPTSQGVFLSFLSSCPS